MKKLKVVALVVWRVRNWGELLLARFGLRNFPSTIRMRSGLEIQMPHVGGSVWGQLFEPLIADVYQAPKNFLGTIIDVGANAGAFTLLAAHQNPRAKLVAFEPQEEVAELLRQNLGRNRLTNVEVHAEPVTGDGRTVVFAECRDQPGSSGIHHQAGAQRARSSVTLDQIPWDRVPAAFLKIDCEGAEGEILAWVAEHRDRLPRDFLLVAEYHPWCPTPLAESQARMEGAGFTCRSREAFQETYFWAWRGDVKELPIGA